eukprot:3675480-Prymnesium_polylepis.3
MLYWGRGERRRHPGTNLTRGGVIGWVKHGGCCVVVSKTVPHFVVLQISLTFRRLREVRQLPHFRALRPSAANWRRTWTSARSGPLCACAQAISSRASGAERSCRGAILEQEVAVGGSRGRFSSLGAALAPEADPMLSLPPNRIAKAASTARLCKTFPLDPDHIAPGT